MDNEITAGNHVSKRKVENYSKFIFDIDTHVMTQYLQKRVVLKYVLHANSEQNCNHSYQYLHYVKVCAFTFTQSEKLRSMIFS